MSSDPNFGVRPPEQLVEDSIEESLQPFAGARHDTISGFNNKYKTTLTLITNFNSSSQTDQKMLTRVVLL